MVYQDPGISVCDGFARHSLQHGRRARGGDWGGGHIRTRHHIQASTAFMDCFKVICSLIYPSMPFLVDPQESGNIQRCMPSEVDLVDICTKCKQKLHCGKIMNLQYSETCIKQPHVGQKSGLYSRGGLLKGAKIYAMTAVGT